MTVKLKSCKSCGADFRPFNSLERVCSVACAIALGKSERERKHKTETRRMRAAMNLKDRSYQLKKAQESFNAFIRERDRGLPCISCGTTNQELRYDAGHYRTTGAHPDLRFEETNCHRQCGYNCNIMRSGNVVDYRIGLVQRIGQARVDWLEGPHQAKNYSLDEIIEIKVKYRDKLKQLRNDKG